MADSKRVLIVVDGSDASRRAVAYVADVIEGAPGFHVGLLHLESPPRMLEWGGSEDPQIEEKKSSQRAATYRQMQKQAVAERQAMLQPMQAVLAERGIDAAVVLVEFEEALDRKTIANDILEIAKQRHYGTVVVGRRLFSTWQSFFQSHVGEEMVRTGEGVAIWVVE